MPVGSVQSVAAQAPRGIRSHHQALRPHATHLMAALGDEPEGWEPAAIRSFFLDRASHCGNGTVEKLTTNLRAFLRYLAVKGRCRAGLADVVPGYAHWRLAGLPRYLVAEQVNRLIAACDGEVVARRRDRAIVLLLARLGPRAGDVAQLCLNDIEWETGSLRVSGKSRYEVRLPLPQDVGDAIVAYLACRPSTCPSDHVFLRNIAPYRPFRKGDGISSVVKRSSEHGSILNGNFDPPGSALSGNQHAEDPRCPDCARRGRPTAAVEAYERERRGGRCGLSGFQPAITSGRGTATSGPDCQYLSN